MASELFTPPELAKEYRVGRATVYRWIRHGIDGIKLGCQRVGGAWRIERAEVDVFFGRLRERAMNGTPIPEVTMSKPGELAKRAAAARERLKLRGI